MENEVVGWKAEVDVNYYVRRYLEKLGKVKNKDFNDERGMSAYMASALKGSAKTRSKVLQDTLDSSKKKKGGVPDFHIETLKHNGKTIPVIIENKFPHKKFIKMSSNGVISKDEKIIGNYAVNDALFYAKNMIASGKYSEVVAIGCAGDNDENVEIGVYFVYGSSDETYKEVSDYKIFDFLENQTTFDVFYKDATLTDAEKHQILIDSQQKLQKRAKELNKLMHNHSITAPQRVLYVSGMLLSMQDLLKRTGTVRKFGLTPDDLLGEVPDKNAKSKNKDEKKKLIADGARIVKRIESYLKQKNIPESKRELMLASFKEISKDVDRDKPAENDDKVKKLLDKPSSVNKQIFTFIYEHIYKEIDAMAGHLDIMGEMYSEFLKYALGDGKEIGIVLTPPYITKMMVEILGVNKDSKVMDLATGSAGFLISAMQQMIELTEKEYGRETTKANEKIVDIKNRQLLGVELNAEMFTLASTNMILRGDGSANISKGNSFEEPPELYEKFGASVLLLNPPFTHEENGMPFLKFGLKNMPKDGKAAIIIQDSAGSGKAITSNKEILKKNQLLASIKMPVDLFQPMAGVQTSIYVFKHTNEHHDCTKQVRFIDFRNDGYKRTKRGMSEIDNPLQRYQDIINIYKNGNTANVSKKLWDLGKTVIDAEITDSGADWNFDQHQIIDPKPTEQDFMGTIAEYLSFEVSQVLKNTEKPYLGKA
jgi:hypothetical protein